MKRILIVEDDPDMQAIYKFMFKDETRRYALQITGDTSSALRAIKRKRFDLIISDIIIRTMKGECFIARVKSDGGIDIPVLVVSVLSSDMLSRLKELPRVYFLQKPITKEKLLKTIGRILRPSRSAAASAGDADAG